MVFDQSLGQTGGVTEWGRSTAEAVQALASAGAVALVPVGSLEQHGPHLPTDTDSRLVTEIAHRAASRAGGDPAVVVLPTVWTGLSEHHVSLGGTVTVGFDAFRAVVAGVVESVVRQGFGRVLVLNGHGGNAAALTVIANELGERLDAVVVTATYWNLAAAEIADALDRQDGIRHACEGETSMLLALAPELVRLDRLDDAVGPPGFGRPGSSRYRPFAALSGVGVVGDARSATAAKGERLLDAAVGGVVALLRDEAVWA
jgi:creatinine amidohydrolase